jgi:hypothetical protein
MTEAPQRRSSDEALIRLDQKMEYVEAMLSKVVEDHELRLRHLEKWKSSTSF